MYRNSRTRLILANLTLTTTHLKLTSPSEPPLNEEDVPPGEWLCPRCRALHDIKRMHDKRKKNSRIGSENPSKHIDKTKLISSGIKGGIELTKTQSEYVEDSHKVRLLSSLMARKSPFADLVKVSLLLNPREFELPEDYVPNIQFPGTSKKIISNTGTREARLTSYSVKRAQELDRNNLPLILRTCYFCRKGCRKAPLIHCDYCPLVYHADCIDPPLTILPNTRWMCPNHVEPTAEEKLLSSSSYCERVKLWNHFAKPVDHESIKVSFLDKVHQTSSLEPSGSEFIKTGCRVPRRVKNEYDMHIVSIDKYDVDSCDEDHQEFVDDAEKRCEKQKAYFTLDQMIESSKLLEASEIHSANGDNIASVSDEKTEILDEDAIDKRQWLEFLQKLANPVTIAK